MKKKGRLVLKIPRSCLEIITEVIAVLGLLAHAFFLFYYWPALPDVIPTHFGFSGEADAWGSKSSLVFLLAVNIGLYLMMTVANLFPHIFNFVVEITEKNAREQYYNARLMMNFLKAETVWIFAYLGWGTIQAALGKAPGLDGTIMLSFIIALTITLLYFVWRSRGIG